MCIKSSLIFYFAAVIVYLQFLSYEQIADVSYSFDKI